MGWGPFRNSSWVSIWEFFKFVQPKFVKYHKNKKCPYPYPAEQKVGTIWFVLGLSPSTCNLSQGWLDPTPEATNPTWPLISWLYQELSKALEQSDEWMTHFGARSNFSTIKISYHFNYMPWPVFNYCRGIHLNCCSFLLFLHFSGCCF